MKSSLLLSFMLATSLACAMERPAKIIKTAANTQPIEQSIECEMLLDAFNNKQQSRYYKPDSNPINLEDDQEGTDQLERALHRHDIQTCINLVAEGHPLDRPFPTNQLPALHVAAQTGMYSFCEFLIHPDSTEFAVPGVDVNISSPDRSMAIHLAAKAHHGKICILLLKHGARTLTKRQYKTWKIFYHLSKCQDISLQDLQEITPLLAAHRARIAPSAGAARQACEAEIFDNLARESTPQRFHELFPLLMTLGADLERLDHCECKSIRSTFKAFGVDLQQLDRCECKPLRRLVRHRWSIHDSTHALINNTTAYHAFLEQTQVKAALTALAIHKYRKDSLLAWLPKDVLKTCVLKYVVPFRVKDVSQCVSEQLTLMQRLLAFDQTLEKNWHYPAEIKEVLPLFDPLCVEQHRKLLDQTTRKLMGLPPLKHTQQ